MKFLALASTALIAALASVPAQAITLEYTLTGQDLDGTVEFAKFQVDQNPTILPANFSIGNGFRVKFISGIFQYGDTVVSGLQDVQFNSDALSGGFFNLPSTTKPNDPLNFVIFASSPQLYSGSEQAPTLLTGNFAAFDAFSGAALTLSVAAVPEPATWTMMIGGFGLAGAALRRRKTLVAFA